RGGFTLLEVLVALTLGSLVVLMAHRLFTGVTDGAARLAEARGALDREANGRRLLAAIVGSIDIGRPGAGDFGGEPHGAGFSTWYQSPEGWLEPRRVTLALSGGVLVLRGLGDEAIRLVDSVTALDLDYLLDYGAGESWVRRWSSTVSAPVAVRVRIARTGDGRREAGEVDTLLLIVGTRG
ncbi:MAG: prepilin-type N-terminal cleavage/methylation domain-containing protein, partial [Gemmatimonadales bacterium]